MSDKGVKVAGRLLEENKRLRAENAALHKSLDDAIAINNAHIARELRTEKHNAALVEATKRLLCHVGLHGMPTIALEQDAEFAESVLARAESAEGKIK
jgi:protein-disulfide isomerase-like protein with CxxC motif